MGYNIMLVIGFAIGFLVAKWFLGPAPFQIIKSEGELITKQLRIYDYVSHMNKAIENNIVKHVADVQKQEINTVEIPTQEDFLDTLFTSLKLVVYMEPDSIKTVLLILGSTLKKQPNIVWEKKQLTIFSKSKSQMLEILRNVSKLGFKWKLNKNSENMT